MNYISQIKAFYDLLPSKELSTGQIALWHALMNINNKCAWSEWFTVASISLEFNTSLSRQGLIKARNSLKQKGLIDFKSNGTKASSYKVTMLYSVQSSVQGSIQASVQDSVQASIPLNKLNETKQDIATATREEEMKNLISFYEANNFGMIVHSVYDDMLYYLDNGVELELIERCMKEAVDCGRTSWKYVKSILQRCKTQLITTVSQFDAEQAKNAKKQTTSQTQSNPFMREDI